MTDRYMNIPPDMIYPNPNNPRKTFDAESMAELVDSIKKHGVLQPLVVVADETKVPQMWRLVCGERRWRAAVEAELNVVPVVVKEFTPEQKLEAMIVENLQRKDVNPIEEANGFKTLLDAGGYTQDELAKKIGCSQAQIANRLRLLELPEPVRENISRGILSPSHGKVLAGFKQLPENVLEKAAEHIAENNIPVAKTEELIARTIIDQGRPLYKNYRYPVDFDTKGCRKCEHRLVVKEPFYGGQEKAPYCINKPCWEEKQAEAAAKKRQEELEKVEAEARAAKEQEKVEADRKRAENEAARVKLQEQIQKVTKQVQKVAPLLESSIQDPVITTLILGARETWENEAGKSYYSDDPNAVAMDRESIITLDGLLEYWQAKNEVCKDATSMPAQFGDSTVIIQEQGIQFTGHEPYTYSGNSRNYNAAGAVKTVDGLLKIENTNGHVLDRLPELPIYYRIRSYQYAGTKIIKQLVGIKTHTRTIMVFGSASATMRKEIFALWIQLVNELPLLDESARVTIEPAVELETRRYLDENGREIFVSAGIGGEEYGTFWRSHTGGLHRVKSPAMPMVSSRNEAQKNLDAWAEGKGLQQVEAAEGVA